MGTGGVPEKCKKHRRGTCLWRAFLHNAIMADPVPWHGGCSAVVVTPCRGDILAGTRTGLRAAPACAVEELGRGGYTQGEEATHRHPFHGCSAGKAGPRERI